MNVTPTTPFLVAAYPAGATFGPRRLRDFELVWLLEGNAVYTRNEQVADAPEGAFVLCRPDATDAFRWDTRRRTRHAFFHFLLTGDLPGTWPALDTWPLVRTPANETDLLCTLFRHLLTWNRRGDIVQTQFLVDALLAAFVTGQSAATDVRRPDLPGPVARALAHIAATLDADPAAKLPLADLADAACVAPEYLCRLFTRTTGHSPAATVRRARLDRAVTLLTRTNYSITEIAAMTGFESPFHFSRCVKALYNHAPRDLRHAANEGTFTPMTHLLPH